MHTENKHLVTAMLLSLVDSITADPQRMFALLHKTDPESHLPAPLHQYMAQIVSVMDPTITTDREKLLEASLMVSALCLIYASEAILPTLDTQRVQELSLELTKTKN